MNRAIRLYLIPHGLSNLTRHRISFALGGILLVATLSGCVERKMIIRSDPADAEVYVDGTRVGTTPVEIPFTWYGTREVSLYKPGREMLVQKATLHIPWYQVPVFDLITDLILPVTLHDIHEFNYVLPPVQSDANKDEVRDRALQMKQLLEEGQ
jgi:hypothetical protein